MLSLALLLLVSGESTSMFSADQQGEWSTTLNQCGEMTTGTILVAPDRLYFWESEFEPHGRAVDNPDSIYGTWFELDEPVETNLSLTLTDRNKIKLQTEWFEVEYVRCENSGLLARYLNPEV